MQLPNCNINGTSRAELLRQYLACIKHLERALAAIQEAYPHGRDYQGIERSPNNPADPHSVAMAEHIARLEATRTLIAQYRELAEHVQWRT